MPNVNYYIDTLEQKIKIAYSACDWGEVVRLREIVNSLKESMELHSASRAS